MDNNKNHLVIYLQSTLIVLVILCATSIEAIYFNSYSMYILLTVFLLQAISSKIYLSHNKESGYPFLLWLGCAFLIPFSKFYSDYSGDLYFLVMNCLAGIGIGRLLATFCRGMAENFSSLNEDHLASESRVLAKALEMIPAAFVLILIYLLMSLQNGLNGLLLVGDLTLVAKFPIIMLIGAIFPIILIVRALKIIYRREQSND
ncbi:hypothetical protein PQO01_13010 [Lentisphaera marina]|uniref:hypothetical protein n=1 Tax=Lentisphaera marina TaxID=1111041 RepID=UPI002365DC1F|nr:hypothetical protein [Lentisphaera marina]MDD7985865.1 hypothetical protein [Lentisphaera marina]